MKEGVRDKPTYVSDYFWTSKSSRPREESLFQGWTYCIMCPRETTLEVPQDKWDSGGLDAYFLLLYRTQPQSVTQLKFRDAKPAPQALETTLGVPQDKWDSTFALCISMQPQFRDTVEIQGCQTILEEFRVSVSSPHYYLQDCRDSWANALLDRNLHSKTPPGWYLISLNSDLPPQLQ